MASELVTELLQATAATSLALGLVLALRRPLRRWAGARIAYAAWGLVPVSLLAVLLPAPSLEPGVARIAAGAVAWAKVEGATEQALAWFDRGDLLLWAWALGAASAFVLMAWRQVVFSRRLRHRPSAEFDVAEGVGPAVVGLWRPRIVMPTDFQARYTPAEQSLVLEHERLHLRRGDLRAQALASLLRCLFWFNPLLHLAAPRFRFDQELACDADVLSRHPRCRRTYGEAMLKTQLADFGLPVGCHWQSCHPLMERLEMLKHPLPGMLRHRTGLLFVSLLVFGGSFAAWAAQPATPAATTPALQAITDADVLTPPAYPKSAADQGISGRVVLKLLVGADGLVKQVEVAKSEPAGVFDEAAIAAARNWRFNPGSRTSTGEPVEGWVMVPVDFQPDVAKAPDAAD